MKMCKNTIDNAVKVCKVAIEVGINNDLVVVFSNNH